MTRSAMFIDRYDLIEAVTPVDLNGGANNGNWISLKEFRRLAVVLHSSVGTNPPTITFQQAKDVAGTGAKALNPTGARCFKKQAAANLAAVGAWTSGSAELAANTWVSITGAQAKLLVAEFAASDLDVNNGFATMRATVAQVGGGALLGVIYYVCEKLYLSAPTSQLSGLVN